jgi:hypothetical protein
MPSLKVQRPAAINDNFPHESQVGNYELLSNSHQLMNT